MFAVWSFVVRARAKLDLHLRIDFLDKYEGRAGMTPSRVVLHKTSQYQSEEEAGLRKATAARAFPSRT